MILCRATLACSVIVAAMPASAQPTGGAAETLYDKGRTLLAAHKTAEACAAFEQSQQLEPAVATLIALATCREMLGQFATAWQLFALAEQQSRSASDNTIAQLHKIALDRAAKLDPRVSKLTIRVSDPSKIAGLDILRGEERIPAGMWNRALPVDGGTYAITARAPGVADWSTSVTLAPASDAATVDVPNLRSLQQSLAKPPKPPVADAPAVSPRAATPASAASDIAQPSKPPAIPDAPKRRERILPITLSIGAVALLGGALGFSLWGDSTYDDAKAEMTDRERRFSLYDSANHKRYAAVGLTVAGAGCASVAVWLYLHQRGTRTEPSRARTTGLLLAPAPAGIGVIGQF